MFRVFLIGNLGVALLLTGCGESTNSNPPVPAAATSNTNRQMFQVKGVVAAVKPAEKSVEIRHEDIPGYMPAMRMPFDVRDTNELAGLEPGDVITFRLIVTENDGWIDQIHKTGLRTNFLPVTTGPFRAVRDVEPLNIGEVLPDYTFTNQFGQSFHTGQFKGQALAINFLFTRCPFPQYCPFLAKSFREVQQKLLASATGPTNWHLLTITFDPDYDTPAVLKTYADMHECNPQRWTFATGALIDVTAIGDQFNLTVLREAPGALPSHSLRTVVIDAAGRVQKIFAGNEWTSDELVAEMAKAAAAK